MQKSPRVVELQCKELKSKQKMMRLRYSDDGEMVWFRCQGCGMNHAFPFATMMRDGFIPPERGFGQSKKKKMVDNTEQFSNAPIEYSPSGVYQVGQQIHHAVLDDVGKIISENTVNGHGKIVVAFEKSGKKILIHGLATSLEEYVNQ